MTGDHGPRTDRDRVGLCLSPALGRAGVHLDRSRRVVADEAAHEGPQLLRLIPPTRVHEVLVRRAAMAVLAEHVVERGESVAQAQRLGFLPQLLERQRGHPLGGRRVVKRHRSAAICQIACASLTVSLSSKPAETRAYRSSPEPSHHASSSPDSTSFRSSAW